MENGESLAIDLENQQLQVITDAITNEHDVIKWKLKLSPFSDKKDIKVKFVDGKLVYGVDGCVQEHFDPQPTACSGTVEEWLWGITKTYATLEFTCNGESLVVVNFAQYDATACTEVWQGDVVKSFVFTTSDTVSKKYQIDDKEVGRF